METLFKLIGVASLSNLFVYVIGYPLRVRLNASEIYKGRIKPFDCELCMAFWLGLWYAYHIGMSDILFFAATCSVLALVIGRKLFL